MDSRTLWDFIIVAVWIGALCWTIFFDPDGEKFSTKVREFFILREKKNRTKQKPLV